jgi:hypothetical protein
VEAATAAATRLLSTRLNPAAASAAAAAAVTAANAMHVGRHLSTAATEPFAASFPASSAAGEEGSAMAGKEAE